MSAALIDGARYAEELNERVARAAGVPGLLGGKHVREGVIAIADGINAVAGPEGTRLVGDLHASVADVAEAVTPVPGGVGPVTDVWLLRNTMAAADYARGTAEVEPATGGYHAQQGRVPARRSA